MLRFASRLQLSARLYSTAPSKPSIKLVAELRQRTEVSIIKAREALSASNNDVSAALAWLEKDLLISGEKRAEKVGGRATNEGLVSVSVLPGKDIRAAMIELNCETDFVGRNDLFGRLAADIAHTAAFLTERNGEPAWFQPFVVGELHEAPLISATDPGKQPTGTVRSSIRDMIAKVGENISLRRAVTVVEPSRKIDENVSFRLATYLHGTINTSTQGRAGVLALLRLKSPHHLLASEQFQENLQKLERSLARQIVGFETDSVEGHGENALYNQPFITFPGELSGQPVQDVLRAWSRQHGLEKEDAIRVLEFKKWSLGS